jgi:hypothetical protein
LKKIFAGVIAKMEHKKLKREIEREALARMEDAARTTEDFKKVVAKWDHLDENRERRERDHEKGRDEQTLDVGYTDGMVLPILISHPAWREAVKGDFLSMIYDSADDMWQLIEDWDVASLVKNLTEKQKEVLFFSVVRLCTPQQIACHKEQTDRAIRKLLTAALDRVRDSLAPLIREQIAAAWPQMTLEKRRFLTWYDKQKPHKGKEIQRKNRP